MATIGSLAVALTARSEGFNRAMSSAQRRSQAFEKSVAGVQRTLGKLGLALSGAALARQVQKAFGELDKAAKFSDRIGIASEALMGLHHAAKLSGVGQDQLDMALQRSTRRIAEAAAGTGEAVTALQRLGLSAQQLAARSPYGQFLAIADAMQGITNQSERVRVAFKLFDSEGVAVLNILRGGSEQIRATVAEAERLGVAFNRIELSRVEAANDAVTRMRAAFGGLFDRLAVDAAPAIVGVAKSLEQVAAGVANVVNELKAANQASGGGLGNLVETLVLGGAAYKLLGKGGRRAIGAAPAALMGMAGAGIDRLFGVRGPRKVGNAVNPWVSAAAGQLDVAGRLGAILTQRQAAQASVIGLAESEPELLTRMMSAAEAADAMKMARAAALKRTLALGGVGLAAGGAAAEQFYAWGTQGAGATWGGKAVDMLDAWKRRKELSAAEAEHQRNIAAYLERQAEKQRQLTAEEERRAALQAQQEAKRRAQREAINDVWSSLRDRREAATLTPTQQLTNSLRRQSIGRDELGFLTHEFDVTSGLERGQAALQSLKAQYDALRGIHPLDALVQDLERLRAASTATRDIAQLTAQIDTLKNMQRSVTVGQAIQEDLAKVNDQFAAFRERVNARGGTQTVGAVTRGSVDAYAAERQARMGFSTLQRTVQDGLALDRKRNELLEAQLHNNGGKVDTTAVIAP